MLQNSIFFMIKVSLFFMIVISEAYSHPISVYIVPEDPSSASAAGHLQFKVEKFIHQNTSHVLLQNIDNPKDYEFLLSQWDLSDQALNQAKKFYESMQIEDAEKQALSAIDGYEQLSWNMLPEKNYYQALYILGSVYALKNNEEKSVDTFKKLLFQSDGNFFIPKESSQAVQELWKMAFDYYVKSERYPVNVYSLPAGSIILLNNHVVGVAPLDKMRLLDGEYQIGIQKFGYKNFSQILTVPQLPEGSETYSLSGLPFLQMSKPDQIKKVFESTKCQYFAWISLSKIHDQMILKADLYEKGKPEIILSSERTFTVADETKNSVMVQNVMSFLKEGFSIEKKQLEMIKIAEEAEKPVAVSQDPLAINKKWVNRFAITGGLLFMGGMITDFQTKSSYDSYIRSAQTHDEKVKNRRALGKTYQFFTGMLYGFSALSLGGALYIYLDEPFRDDITKFHFRVDPILLNDFNGFMLSGSFDESTLSP